MTVIRKLGLLTALAAIVSLAPGGTAHASTVSSQSGPIHTAAARSVTVQFINSYTGPLTLHSTHLSHGKWVVRPPNTIDVGSTAVWASVSNGIFTGTEGEARFVVYGFDDNEELLIVRWDNPFVDSNSFSCDPPAPLECNTKSSGGNTASVSFELF